MISAIRLTMACLVVTVVTAGQMQAGLINGGFESDMAGWSSIGDAGPVGAPFGSGPIAGFSSGLITNAATGEFGSAVSDAALEAFLGLAPGSLDALSLAASVFSATEGSAIITRVAATSPRARNARTRCSGVGWRMPWLPMRSLT